MLRNCLAGWQAGCCERFFTSCAHAHMRSLMPPVPPYGCPPSARWCSPPALAPYEGVSACSALELGAVHAILSDAGAVVVQRVCCLCTARKRPERRRAMVLRSGRSAAQGHRARSFPVNRVGSTTAAADRMYAGWVASSSWPLHKARSPGRHRHDAPASGHDLPAAMKKGRHFHDGPFPIGGMIACQRIRSIRPVWSTSPFSQNLNR